MVKQVIHAINVLKKHNVRNNSSRITDNTKFHKRKTQSEEVKEKEKKKHDEQIFDTELIKGIIIGNINLSSLLTKQDDDKFTIKFWKTLNNTK